MKIVIAPDSFKECLSAAQVANAIYEGICKLVPDAEIISIPLADGGEGTVQALVTATGGRITPALSVDALNRPIESFYGILGDGKTAVIEMAAASGLEKLTPEERNPIITSTFGTGLLLKAALDAGYTNIILGIGGSATNDGGSGLAQALGYGLLNKDGKQINPGGGSLIDLCSIDRSMVNPMLATAKITVACDVQNPLLGASGATRIYGPQKGANTDMLNQLEMNLTHFSQILDREFETDWSNHPGSGAAGGLGYGLLNFCQAEIVSGFGLICQLTNLEEHIQQSSLVFTGEGKIDAQTIFGKTVSGMAKMAKKHQVPVVALCGKMEDDLNELYSQGITVVIPIGEKTMSLTESIERAAELLAKTSERVMRLLSVIEKNEYEEKLLNFLSE